MTDLTKIDRPFEELDDLTRWALKGAHAEGETIENRGTVTRWRVTPEPFWTPGGFYRIKPKRVREAHIHEMQAFFCSGEHPPMLSAGHKHDEGWTRGTAVTSTVDGKPTRIVWEADK